MAEATQVQAPTSADDIWTMEVPPPQQAGDFEPCPPGNHAGNIVGLFDVGVHEEEYKGKKKENRKLVVAFEVQTAKKDGNHQFLAKQYTWSMGDSSNWYKLIVALTARHFSEGEKFPLKSVLGMPCMILVTNEKKVVDGKEKTYVQIESITKYPEAFPPPTNYRPPITWSVREGTPLPDVSWVPKIYGDSIEEMVATSKGIAGGSAPAEANGAPAPAANGEKPPF